MSENYIIHSSHKYIDRKWVNGAWHYIYETTHQGHANSAYATLSPKKKMETYTGNGHASTGRHDGVWNSNVSASDGALREQTGRSGLREQTRRSNHQIILDRKTKSVRRPDGSLYSIRTSLSRPNGVDKKKHERKWHDHEYDGDQNSIVNDPNFTYGGISSSDFNNRDSIGKFSYLSKKRYGYDGFYNANGEPVHKVYHKKYRRQ